MGDRIGYEFFDWTRSYGSVERNHWKSEVKKIIFYPVNKIRFKYEFNSRYKQAVTIRSKLIRDRPMNALDTAAYWVEYVIRHNGAPHMHYPGADQNFAQQNSLDLIVFILFVLYVVVKLTKCTFKFVLKKFCSKGKAKKQKKN